MMLAMQSIYGLNGHRMSNLPPYKVIAQVTKLERILTQIMGFSGTCRRHNSNYYLMMGAKGLEAYNNNGIGIFFLLFWYSPVDAIKLGIYS